MVYNPAPVAKIRPEVELLLCCTRTCMDSETAQRARALLQKQLDWDYLLRSARRHRMKPLLYWHLNAICPEAVPKACLDGLRDEFRANAQSNLYLTKELLALLCLFEEHSIPAIPFKGPVLTVLVYGNLALRRFGDLDILVSKRDVLKAEELLISKGYRPRVHLVSARERVRFQSSYAQEFVHDNGRGQVDLHWKLAERYFLHAPDPEPLWERLEPVSLAEPYAPSRQRIYSCSSVCTAPRTAGDGWHGSVTSPN